MADEERPDQQGQNENTHRPENGEQHAGSTPPPVPPQGQQPFVPPVAGQQGYGAPQNGQQAYGANQQGQAPSGSDRQGQAPYGAGQQGQQGQASYGSGPQDPSAPAGQQGPSGQAAYGADQPDSSQSQPQPPYGSSQPGQPQPPYGAGQPQPPYGAQPGPAGTPGQPAQPGQPSQPGQPGQPGQPPYGAGQPGPYAGQPGQPGQPGYGAAYFPAGGPGPQKPRMDPKKKKRVILLSVVAAAVVLLLAIGGIVAAVVVGANNGPEALVRNYLTAISEGKAEEANKLVDPGLGEEETVLLTDDVLRESPEFISKPKVSRISSSRDSAYASITYVLDGRTYDATLDLSKDDGKWTIDKPLLSTIYMYSSTNTKASVNGTTVDFTDKGSIQAYPAVYDIGAPEGDLFEAEAQTFTAGTGGKANYEGIELGLKPTKALTDAVQKEVNAHLDECVASTDTNPEGCGLRIPTYLDFSSVSSVAYKVNTYPTVTVDENGRYFESGEGDVGATVNGTKFDGSAGTVEYGSDDWGPSGKINIDDDEKVSLEFY
jgi:hypothetical protein